MEITKDKNGKESSKRITGLFVGIPVCVILTIIGVFTKFNVVPFLPYWFGITGGLLGLGVLEGLRK